MSNIPQNRPVSLDAIYNRLKIRILEALMAEPYQLDDGTWVDPVSPKDLAGMGNLVLKMLQYEQTQNQSEDTSKKITPIPSFPALLKGQDP